MQKYKKIRIVGKGSFGFAVLVQSKKSKKQFIIKIIDISKMDEKQIQEALTQVQVLKVMRYPYVVSYRESFMEKSCLCIVMDYCEGGDLFNKIAKQKQIGVLFPEQQILTWFVQMALALKHVHDRKILHRDLKTQNIFLTSKGEVKIGDFGIARVLQHTYDCANTAIGTPYYLSPEICQQKPYNQKSDIWSLGCILYQLTTLNHAFDAQNMKGLVQKILKGTYPPIPQVYSSDLKKIISELLIKDPNKRPSIRKILQTPFLKARVNELFSNTLQLHESQLQKQGTSILDLRTISPSTTKKQQETQKKTMNNFGNVGNNIQQRNFKKGQKHSKIQVLTRHAPLLPSNNNISNNPLKKNQGHGSSTAIKPVQLKPVYFGQKKQPTPQKHISGIQNYSKQTLQKKNKIIQSTPIPGITTNQNNIYLQQHQPILKKPKQIDQEETLEQQGYKHLLNQMKNFIQGGSNNNSNLSNNNNNNNNNQDENDFGNDNIAPKFLNLKNEKFYIPGMNQRDTTGSKIEALRMYLQKQIGNDQFIRVYKAIANNNDNDDDFSQAKKLLGDKKIKYIPLILQLIVCEDSYY